MRAKPRATRVTLLPAVALSALALLFVTEPPLAQEPPAEPVEQTEQADPGRTEPDPEPTREQTKEQKRLEREERIEQYLRDREERQIAKEQKRMERSPAPTGDPTADAAQAAAAGAAAVGATGLTTDPDEVEVPTKKKKKKKATSDAEQQDVIARSALPRRLAIIHHEIWSSPFAEDPTVQDYMLLIDRGDATAEQIAAFANFLGQNGLIPVAIDYYGLAVALKPEDSLLWLNLGTLYRQIGDLGEAADAYSRSLNIDVGNALAHYNLGAVLDTQGKYQPAIEEYKLALTIDPTLGDPAVNSQAANNSRLMAVKLMIYQEQTGTLGTSLVEVPGGGLDHSPIQSP